LDKATFILCQFIAFIVRYCLAYVMLFVNPNDFNMSFKSVRFGKSQLLIYVWTDISWSFFPCLRLELIEKTSAWTYWVQTRKFLQYWSRPNFGLLFCPLIRKRFRLIKWIFNLKGKLKQRCTRARNWQLTYRSQSASTLQAASGTSSATKLLLRDLQLKAWPQWICLISNSMSYAWTTLQVTYRVMNKLSNDYATFNVQAKRCAVGISMATGPRMLQLTQSDLQEHAITVKKRTVERGI